MQLGIDFGTTRTLVAAVDRGNFPVVSFVDDAGDVCDHVPSVAAAVDGRVVYGAAAVAAGATGAPMLRSFKRLLSSRDISGETPVRIGDVELSLHALLTGFLSTVREGIARSNVPKKRGDKALDVVVAVPAHAYGPQRCITLAAFEAAGFHVKAMLHEPSAAGFEYTHRQPKTVTSRRTRVVVYDLGGGTFDASLVRVDAAHHEVCGTVGDNRLGGDDFDDVLFACALAKLGVDGATLPMMTRRRLLDRCREAKERLTPQARRVAIDVDPVDIDVVGAASIDVAIDDFSAAAAPLVLRSVEAMAPLLASDSGADGAGLDEIAGIYLVGGASGLPLVPRLLKERFGRRVHRSPYPAASVAIGLAIAASDELGFTLADRFSRCFGVFRERDAGRALRFDPIFTPQTTLPRLGGAIEIVRRYRAAHNVGHFRYVECSRVSDDGDPIGDVVPFGEVCFAFDKGLRGQSAKALKAAAVTRVGAGPEVEERYVIDDAGVVAVSITDVTDGHTQTFRLGT